MIPPIRDNKQARAPLAHPPESPKARPPDSSRPALACARGGRESALRQSAHRNPFVKDAMLLGHMLVRT